MSKQKTNIENSAPVNEISFSGGYFYFPSQIDNIIGKLLTLAETLGLKDTQEKAYKDMVRNVVYEFCGNTKWVNSDIVNKIMEYSDKCGNTPHTPRK